MAKQTSISRYEETIQSLFMSSALPSTTEANQILQRPTEPCHALPSLTKANQTLPSLTNLQWIFASPTEPNQALPSPTELCLTMPYWAQPSMLPCQALSK